MVMFFSIIEMVIQLIAFMINFCGCLELDERMEDLKKELQSFEGEESDESHKKKALDALKRMENWNLFSDTHEVSCFIGTNQSTGSIQTSWKCWQETNKFAPAPKKEKDIIINRKENNPRDQKRDEVVQMLL